MFRIELFSRWYGPYLDGTKDKRGLGNGDELTRDGYKFCGKGLKQLTGRGNYKNFTDFRNAYPFPGDPMGVLDFTSVTNKTTYDGNYNKLADKDNVIYAVQSALWFYQKGGLARSKKYSVDWADEDNIEKVSIILNGGNNGKELRRDYTFKARKEFKVYDHYKEMHKKGTVAEKHTVLKRLKTLSTSEKVKASGTYDGVWKTIKIDLKDTEAKKLWDEFKPKALELPKPKGIALKIESGSKIIPYKKN